MLDLTSTQKLIMRTFRFKSKRVKKFKHNFKQPDYYSIIKLNKTAFTLTGWLGETDSDISYLLEEITQERLDKDKYLMAAYAKWIRNERKNGRF